MAANSPLLRPQPRVSCVGKRGDRPADARVEALNLKDLCLCGGRVNRRGRYAQPCKACWRVFSGWRQQAMRGSALRPPGLCLPLAHLRHRGARANAGHRALAGHAPMRTGGGRPGGAGGISRPFFGAGCLASVPPNNLFRASGHIFKICECDMSLQTVESEGTLR